MILAKAHVASAQVGGALAPALPVAGRVPIDALVVAATLHAGVAPADVDLVADLRLGDAAALARPLELVEAERTFGVVPVGANFQPLLNI